MTEGFIQKAIQVHGDKYDYSKVEYVKNLKEVIIICKEHGEFLQLPRTHKRGNGCHECGITNSSNARRLTTDEFIEKAIQVHGDKYDYSKVKYVKNLKEVIIICKEHGEFLQLPKTHKRGNGCIKCANNYNYTTKEWIDKAIEVHGDKYEYLKVNYISNKKKVIITCKEHGDFEQIAKDHLHGGCIKCANKYNYTTKEWIDKAIQVHGDKYEYSKVNYISNKKKVIITCKEHGDFEQNANSHLHGGGCYLCNPTGHSKIQIKWLDFISSYNHIKIQHAENGGEFIIPNTRLKTDGYCQETNTVYEFHGDLWHGNPKLFNQEDTIFFGKTYGELYQKTIEREKQIKNMGFNLVVIWESDWIKINNSIKTIQNIFRLFK